VIYHGPASLVDAIGRGELTEGDADAVNRFADFLAQVGQLPVCTCDAHPGPHKHAPQPLIDYARGIQETPQ
jgi:hypothetical protein